MTAFGITPRFRDKQGWLSWKEQWKAINSELAQQSCILKKQLSSESDTQTRARLQKQLRHIQRMIHKTFGLLQEGKTRRDYLISIRTEHERHIAQWPIDFGNCRNIDFHFNKKYLEFDFLPMWIVKVKGQTFYCNSVISTIGFNTKENPKHPSTKGLIRFKKANLYINVNGVAHIS